MTRISIRSARLAAWGWWSVGLASSAAVLGLNPAAVGLSQAPVFAQAVALRGVTGIGLLSGAAAAGASLRLPAPSPPFKRVTLAGVLLAAGLGQGAIQWSRAGGPVRSTGPADLVVLAYNTQRGRTDAQTVAALARTEQAQVLALPETWPEMAAQLAELLTDQRHRYQVFSSHGARNLPTSLLIRSDLGPYREISAPDTGYGTVRAVPTAGGGPAVVATHSVAPPRPWRQGHRTWVRTTRAAVGLATSADNVVIAGDFNATVDHAVLRGLGRYADAATAAGRGADGTWPAKLPGFLASPIDHVLYDAKRWRTLSTHTVRVGHSDHRALVARLAEVG